MTDADTITYRTAQLVKAAPRGTFHPNLVLSGPDGKTNHLPITPAEYARVVEALTTDPGITYAVQPHDITTLTAPMWEACGIECPAMIGATCPGTVDGVITRCPGKSAKFPHAAAEVVWGWSLESFQDDTCGEADSPIGWNALFRFRDTGRAADGTVDVGVVLHTDSQGFVSLARYTSAVLMESEWADLLKREADYERANCEDCTPGTPCDDHADD